MTHLVKGNGLMSSPALNPGKVVFTQNLMRQTRISPYPVHLIFKRCTSRASFSSFVIDIYSAIAVSLNVYIKL